VLAVLCCVSCAPTDPASDGDNGEGEGEVVDGGRIDARESTFIDAGADGAPFVPVDAGNCNDLKVTVRDFTVAHPDFESFTADGVFPGLVKNELGPDRKPVYALPGGTIHTTGPAAFAQWYSDVPGVNMTIPVVLSMNETAPGSGIFVYESNAFFPIDNQGFGNQGNPNNFHFTTEIHLSFVYKGGEIFRFRGDDDFWLFINGKLALDLGGLHQPAEGTINLDAMAAQLGITPGSAYSMDIFHAERHTTGSNFRVESTIKCLVVIE
jgi:fibro-slime domain-containing protein